MSNVFIENAVQMEESCAEGSSPGYRPLDSKGCDEDIDDDDEEDECRGKVL